jgi:hypothetical protein
MFRYVIDRKDVEDPTKTSVSYNGTWNRITPWLPWMLLGAKPGHCLYVGDMGATDSLDVVPKDILAYCEKNLPKFLSAPTEDYGPSLSSIENCARQQPAPVGERGAGGRATIRAAGRRTDRRCRHRPVCICDGPGVCQDQRAHAGAPFAYVTNTPPCPPRSRLEDTRCRGLVAAGVSLLAGALPAAESALKYAPSPRTMTQKLTSRRLYITTRVQDRQGRSGEEGSAPTGATSVRAAGERNRGGTERLKKTTSRSASTGCAASRRGRW